MSDCPPAGIMNCNSHRCCPGGHYLCHYYFFPTEGDNEDEVVCGAHVRDVITGEEFDVRAKCVVNATGPFTDAVRQMDNPTGTKICQPSAGVHIVLPEYYRYAPWSVKY